MKLTVVLAVLIGILVLACSTAAPAPVDPTPNIDATVEARVAHERAVNATVAARLAHKPVSGETPEVKSTVDTKQAATGVPSIVISPSATPLPPVQRRKPWSSEQRRPSFVEHSHRDDTQLNSEGYHFKFTLACVSEPCLNLSQFADRVRTRTAGQVDIQTFGYSELGFSLKDGMAAVADGLPLINDGSLQMGEVLTHLIDETIPIARLPELRGIYKDDKTWFDVIDAIGHDLYFQIGERANGVVITENYHPDNVFYFFSNQRLTSPQDFIDLRFRRSIPDMNNLLLGLGAIPQDSFYDSSGGMYQWFHREEIDIAVCQLEHACGQGQFITEVIRYVTGPVVGGPFGVVVMNDERWNKIPVDLRSIIFEEGRRNQEESRRVATKTWRDEKIKQYQEQGVELLPVSAELSDFIQAISIETILPAWVDKTDGPNSSAVRTYNNKVSPIVGIEILPNGGVRRGNGN